MTWSAAQYTKFEDERTRPVRDLVARIPDINVKTAIDIGCGPGNSTEVLAVRFPQAKISGMDSSADMIAAAKKRLPQLDFAVSDISGWQGSETFDIILSNAVLQWLPNHDALLSALVARLNKGGCIAVQIPTNLAEPAQTLMRDIANDGTWTEKLKAADATRHDRHNADWYYRQLHKLGLKTDIWQTTYYHPLAGGADAIVEWFRGTGLRPFIDPLDEAERGIFLSRYRDAVAKAYPALLDGSVLLPFPRLFFVAQRV